MNSEQTFLNNLEGAINSSQDLEQIAESVEKIEVPKSSDFGGNTEILAEFVYEFQFDWDNEAYNNQDEFVNEAVKKIKQILADIKSNNQYRRVFSAEVAYSKLNDDDYSYKLISENMKSKTVDEAIKEKDEIRAKALKQHPDDKDYVLEDVRVRVKIVDSNDKTVLEERFLLN